MPAVKFKWFSLKKKLLYLRCRWHKVWLLCWFRQLFINLKGACKCSLIRILNYLNHKAQHFFFIIFKCFQFWNNLARQMGCFLNLLDSFYISTWERAQTCKVKKWTKYLSCTFKMDQLNVLLAVNQAET